MENFYPVIFDFILHFCTLHDIVLSDTVLYMETKRACANVLPRPPTWSKLIIMAALYSDSDYDEEFEDDYSPTRCVVPSYAQLYSLQLTAGGGAGDEDDGWNSDDESCKPVIPAMEEDEGV